MSVPVVAIIGLAVLMILPLPDERGVAFGAVSIVAVVILWIGAALRRLTGGGKPAPGRDDVYQRSRIARRA